MALASSARPIEGAVATLGTSDRVDFLRKTYAHLGAALIAFAAVTGGLLMFAPKFSWGFSKWAVMGGGFKWLIVLGLFMVVGYVAERLATSESSRGLQYAGLGLAVVAEAVILQPLLWILMLKFGSNEILNAGTLQHPIPMFSDTAVSILTQSVVITLAIFIGLTLVVFVTKKDFSFLRGILTICTFGALGIIVTSILFGFSLGALFCGAMILLMAGYILYQTSLVLAYFPPTAYVASALMLFSTVATLFWYVLQLVMSLRSGD